ncbi:MAG: hypothetical protein LLG97_15595 [Deltaproteobacteria bacterium]|nr:hypothetical protein [Deltaproteobacteria bacterium]
MNRVLHTLRMMGFMVLFLLGLMHYGIPSAGAAAAGNVNGDSEINLSDAIISLRICAKLPPGAPVVTDADVNGDGEIGMEEAIYVLQTISALRSSGPLRVSAPNGGEALTAGSTYTITWQASTDIQTVDILLSVDSGATYPYTLVSGTPNDGAYTWEPVPFHSPLKLSTACRIRIRDSLHPATVSDESDGPFSLVAAGVPMLLETLYAINQRLKNAPGGLEKDTDGDGLYDNVELYLGTDPKHKDSDKDGYSDYHEVFGDVLDIPVPDRDGDGKIAALDNDDDGDGKNDGRLKDSDGDGIPDYLELYGFVYRQGTADLYYPWDGDITVPYYKTDPNQSSTDADQYPDNTEITGTNMDVTVMSPGNNPMIAAFPNFIVRMVGYTVTVKTAITETNGTVHEVGSTWEQSVEQSSSSTKETHWDLSTSVSASYSLTDIGVSVEVGYSYGESTSKTQTRGTSSSRGGQMSNATEWSRATCVDTANAAEITFTFEVQNVGTCVAKEVRITQNVLIGDKNIRTMTSPENAIGQLTVNETRTWSSDVLTLTLDQLRALRMGVPVTVEVSNVAAKVVKRVGSDYVDVNDWGLYHTAAKNVSTQLFMDLGDGNTTEQLVYAGKADGSQVVTLRDVLIWAANGQDSPEGPKVRFYKPDGTLGNLAPLSGWYFSMDKATYDGNSSNVQTPGFNFFDMVIRPGSLIVAKAPPVMPTPRIRWGELSPRQGKVKAYVDDYFFRDPVLLEVSFVDKYGASHPMAWDPAEGYYACACPPNGGGTAYFKDGTEKIVARNPMYYNTNDPRHPQYKTELPVAQMSYVPSFEHTPAVVFEAPLYLVRDVFVKGNYAYLANGETGLLIVDINPASPQYLTTVGSCMVPTIANGNRVFVSGDYAYMTDDYGGFNVFNVADPANPTFVGSCSLGGWHSTNGIFVSGSRAYIANGDTGLLIVDVADPAHPTILGSYDTSGQAKGVYVSGVYAYVADGPGGLVIVNAADPAQPTLAGAYDTPGDAGGVAVSGGYAYVADGSNGLVIINVADPASPAFAGAYDTPGQAYEVFVSGNVAYVADGQGLQAINVADPENPTLAGSSGTVFDAERVFVAGGHAYLTGGDFGSNRLQIVDVNPAGPDYLLTGTCNTPGQGNGVFVSGGHAYVTDGNYGLQIIDVTNALHPVLVGSYDTTGWAKGVFVAGSYAYVADGEYGLQIVDVTNPAQPTKAGSYDTPGYASGVFVSGDYAYVADGAKGLLVVDVNPASPGYLNTARTYDTPGQASGVFVSGNHAYVADGSSGLRIFNVTNPLEATPVAHNTQSGGAEGVFVSGGYAYVADGSSGLQVVDVNPASPGYLTVVGSCDTPGFAADVSVSGGYAYIADGPGGLVVVDVNPASPGYLTIAGSSKTGLYPMGVFASGDYVYVGNYYGGLQVINFR